jgi:hypothetical protein
MAASTLLSNPNRHRAAPTQLIKNAYRNPVESNMRHNKTTNNKKCKNPIKEKAKNRP